MLMSIGKNFLVLCLTYGKPSSHFNRFFIKTYLLFHFIVQFLNSVHFFSFNLKCLTIFFSFSIWILLIVLTKAEWKIGLTIETEKWENAVTTFWASHFIFQLRTHKHFTNVFIDSRPAYRLIFLAFYSVSLTGLYLS